MDIITSFTPPSVLDGSNKKNAYKAIVGHVTCLIKLKYGVHGDHAMLSERCNKHVKAHQASLGASVYAIQYHFKEGYSPEAAMIRGCLLWNKTKQCEFFKCSLDMLGEHALFQNAELVANQEMIDDISLLQKMCRTYHDRAHDVTIDRITFVKKERQPCRSTTFWMCFEDALELHESKTKLTEKSILRCLKKWNQSNNVDVFII